MKDKLGNNYEEPKEIRDAELCEIEDCPQCSFDVTGFVCSLSVFDHKDAIRPSGCWHRKFRLGGKNAKQV